MMSMFGLVAVTGVVVNDNLIMVLDDISRGIRGMFGRREHAAGATLAGLSPALDRRSCLD